MQLPAGSRALRLSFAESRLGLSSWASPFGLQAQHFSGEKGCPWATCSSWLSLPRSAASLPLPAPARSLKPWRTRLSSHSNLTLQEAGFLLELLCFYLSGLAGETGVCLFLDRRRWASRERRVFITHRERENGRRGFHSDEATAEASF